MTIEELEQIITQQNDEIATLSGRLKSAESALKNYEKLHAHEKRQLWMSLRDKYAMALLGAGVEQDVNSVFILADECMRRREVCPNNENVIHEVLEQL